MTFNLRNIAPGVSRAFLDKTIYNVKDALSKDSYSADIDYFIKPIVTAFLDTMQAYSIQKRSLSVWSKGVFLKQVSNPFSNWMISIFLLSKTALNIINSLARGTISSDTKQKLRKIHNAMEASLPIISAIIVIASMNIAYISAYFSFLCLSSLVENGSTLNDTNIYRNLLTMLGISSLLILKDPKYLTF